MDGCVEGKESDSDPMASCRELYTSLTINPQGNLNHRGDTELYVCTLCTYVHL